MPANERKEKGRPLRFENVCYQIAAVHGDLRESMSVIGNRVRCNKIVASANLYAKAIVSCYIMCTMRFAG
ncbi:MAG: hypothetical protein BroJett021_03280 [Chloroflexota bacterium]|nr:MAG: hypothetical protein BroJett021_03280 [Chloroflexota bacterium]